MADNLAKEKLDINITGFNRSLSNSNTDCKVLRLYVVILYTRTISQDTDRRYNTII